MSTFPIQEFLDDFLAEAGEHLQSLNQNLLALEELRAHPTPQAAVEQVAIVNELFRSFHTLKGLSGMVGLAPAEELSHAMESVLRAIQHTEIELSQAVLDLLFSGTQALGLIVEKLRNPNAQPVETAGLLAGLAGLLASPEEAARSAAQPHQPAPLPAKLVVAFLENHPDLDHALSVVERQKLDQAAAAGRRLSLAIFTPSPEKSAQGENVNEIRRRLSESGEIIKAMPLVSGAQIRFAFLVASVQPLDPDQFPLLEWENVAEEAPAEPEPGLSNRPAPLPDTVRVELARLDELMRLVSDLVIARARLADLLPELTGASPAAREALEQTAVKMERSLRDLRRAVMSTRMVPLAEVFNHMPLAVRDLARISGKEVRLVLQGEHTEVDKLLVERLLDPLLHLVRNAIIHGIESPEERQAAGKSVQGVISLRAHQEGDRILVEVGDDGRGINVAEVAAKARRLGWLPADADQDLSETDVLNIICRPGFSTRQEADLGAGRGVGLEVVQKMVAAVGGALTLHTQTGEGAAFTLHLPLTLTIVDALIVRCGPERYAIPMSMVDAVIEINSTEVVRVEGNEFIPYRDGSLTLLRLSERFRLPAGAPRSHQYGLITVESDRRTALVVDQLIGLREVVVRTINDPLVARPGLAGATELGDGGVVLILDVPALFQFFKQQRQNGRQAGDGNGKGASEYA